MTCKQFRRVRIAYRFPKFADNQRLQKVRGAYPTGLAQLAVLEEEILAGMKVLEEMLSCQTK